MTEVKDVKPKIYPNPYDEYKDNFELKKQKYQEACNNNAVAYCSDNTTKPLKSVDVNSVIFCGGTWKVQDAFPYDITVVRKKEMVIFEKLNFTDRMNFDYYAAKSVSYWAYGPSILPDNFCIKHYQGKYNYVVAQCETDKGLYQGYGQTIEQARAFLGLKILDEYPDLISSVIRTNIKKHRTK